MSLESATTNDMRRVADGVEAAGEWDAATAARALRAWADRLDGLQAALEAALRDPQAVHINMLRGGIAKLSPNTIAHMYRGEQGQAVIDAIWREALHDEARVEDLAIRLCAADGQDPWAMTYQSAEPGVMEPYGDCWTHYLPQARALMQRPTEELTPPAMNPDIQA